MGKKNTTNNKAFKKGKTKRAFTLIELLAVILILGIIALIAGTTIYNMVEHSRKEAYKATVRGVLKSAEHYVTSYPLLNRGKISYPVVFTCDGKECSNGTDKLEVEGKLPEGGQIIIESSSSIKASYLRNDRYCAFGDKVNIEVNKNCDKIDKTSPTTPTSGSIGKVEGNNPKGTIKVLPSGSTDDHSEVTYEYLVDNKPDEPSKDDKRFTKSTEFDRACGKKYYGWAIAVDASGNRSDVFYLGETEDGENVYSEWSECSKTCGGGTRTRTNTCALVKEGLSEACNTQGCSYPAVVTTYNATATTSTYTATSSYSCHEYHAGGSGGACASDCVSNCFVYADGSGNWECNKRACGTSYTCPNGGTPSGSTCKKTVYKCNGTDKLNNKTCTSYTCPDGGTLDGTTCVKE